MDIHTLFMGVHAFLAHYPRLFVSIGGSRNLVPRGHFVSNGLKNLFPYSSPILLSVLFHMFGRWFVIQNEKPEILTCN